MRNRLMTVTAALVLASAVGAAAQTPPSPQPVAAPASSNDSPIKGILDLGGLFGDVSGDGARYERYRDTRNGVFSDIRFSKEAEKYFLEASANHIGYRDQRYELTYDTSKVKVAFLFDSLPLNYLYDATTPWSVGSNTLALPDQAQQAVQNRQVNGVPCAYLYPCTNPAAAATALANRSVYNTVLNTFDMQSKRETLGVKVDLTAPNNFDADVSFLSAKKSGYQPWGGSHAFSNANELPIVLDNRTNDFGAGLGWNGKNALLRLGWTGSWFNNNEQTLVWDNPIRLVDYNSGNAAVPWDASGYSNGNGAAQGRMALYPSNTQQVVSAMGQVKFPLRSVLNANLSFTSQEQNESLIPWSINNVVNSTAPSRGFPGLASLPRSTADASAKGLNALFTFTTKPLSFMGLNARYRYNDRDVQTPVFDATEYVRFDAVPEDIEEGFSHQYDVNRQNLDLNALFTFGPVGAIRVGYGHEKYERHGRGFSDTGEDVLRASYDAYSLGWFGLRLALDYGERRGEGFVESGSDYEVGPGGTQPGLRYYDEADRDRLRGSAQLTIMPADRFDIYAQLTFGRDEYLADDSVPEGRQQFGLLDQEVVAWSVGLNYSLREDIAFGASYGQDKYESDQRSRNANPPPDASWNDPLRNWNLDNTEKVNNFNVYADITRWFKISYDFSDSDNELKFGGPRILTLAATPPGQFVPLPNVVNTWHRLQADLKYFFTKQVGVGVGYYYEKLDIEDFATIDTNGPVGFTAATGDPRIDYLGGLIIGYGNRPYDGQNVFVRLLYAF
jgi:MtrB/PioB family decaheme-associated outer membrane protein